MEGGGCAQCLGGHRQTTIDLLTLGTGNKTVQTRGNHLNPPGEASAAYTAEPSGRESRGEQEVHVVLCLLANNICQLME